MPESSTRSSVESLKPFFRPRTVAVIGASRDRTGVGHRLLESLLGSRFSGTIFPVNPHATEIAGLPVYSKLTAVPDPVDLAIVAVPPDLVLSVIGECAAKNVPAIVLITAGFSETGESGFWLGAAVRGIIR
ncbi:CoA-binding protein, partial [Petrachloros mirabilis]